MQGKMAAAPAHLYREITGSGIKWDEASSTVSLWDKHNMLAAIPMEQAISASTPLVHVDEARYAFWHKLAFIECFPQIDYWWFGSYWTGKVRVGYPDQLVKAGRAGAGTMQFVDEYSDANQWTIETRTITSPQAKAQIQPASTTIVNNIEPVPVPYSFVEIGVPLPPFEESEDVNLPLKLKLAQLALQVLQGERPGNQWELVTSLVNRFELSQLLPTRRCGWQLVRPSHVVTSPIASASPNGYYEHTFRELFCYSLGLTSIPTPQLS